MKHAFDWKKIIISAIGCGVAGLAIMFILTPVFYAIFPLIEAEYTNPLFRPMDNPWMSYIFLNPFVMGLIMAVLYPFVTNTFKIKELYKKGAHFGLLIWLLGIPGMLMTFSSFNLSAEIVISWTIQMLISYVAYGIIIAKIFKK
jgi:hypothetical protein